MLAGTAEDLRYGLRRLLKSPGFSAVAVLSLALGIGANTAIFTLIDAVMLGMLPVKNPQELVSLNITEPAGAHVSRSTDGNTSTAFPYPAFVRMRANNQVFSALFAFKVHARLNAEVDGETELTRGQLVTPASVSSSSATEPARARSRPPSAPNPPLRGAAAGDLAT